MQRGYTIVELTIVLAVISILSAIAIPRAGALLDGIHVRGAATEIETLFATARHTAIMRGRSATVDIDAAAKTLTVHVASDTVRSRDLGQAHAVRLATTRASMTYAPTGLGYGAANLTVIVSRGGAADTLYVSRLGRVRH